MSNFFFQRYLPSFSIKLGISPLSLGLIVFGLSLVTEKVLLREYARNKIYAVSDAVSASRNFQGLLLDGPGTAALILNVMERQDFFTCVPLLYGP